MDITGKKLFAKALVEEGVTSLFTYPGGNILDVLDELHKQDKIRLILPRHEQALVHAAEGYARASGDVGVCLVTSGPGATNTVTPIADAFLDGVPLVVFVGQVAQPLIGNDAFQEVDIIGMTRGVTKYGVTVRNRKELGKIIKMAFYIARSGKPGPVIVEIPKDIQVESGPAEYPEHVDIRGYKPNYAVHVGQLKKAFRLLKNAKRPLILAGGGVLHSGASPLLREFAQKMRVPVATTVMGFGAMGCDDELYVGNTGMHGRYAANMAVGTCDVLFSIGTRFNDRITGDLNEFAPHAKIVHIDIDTASISRNVVVDVPVVADASVALEKLIEWAQPKSTTRWISTIREWDETHPLEIGRPKGLSPKKVLEGINERFASAIITTDVGQHQMWATQFLRPSSDGMFITSGGLGTMGFGFPAAVGAKFARPDKDVVCITGDGGMQMNMQEMATVICENAPVVVIIFNNNYLGMVKQQQNLFCGKRYTAVCLRRNPDCNVECKGRNEACPPEYVPDFVKWADSYGVEGIRVSSEDEIASALDKAKANIKDGRSIVVEFMISAEELVLPMVKGGSPLTEMILK